jgi:hypothetical protein
MSEHQAFAASVGPVFATDRRASQFLGLLILIALVPLGVAVLAETAVPGATLFGSTSDVLSGVGTAHVGLTGFFWFDRRYSAQIARRPFFFYAVPAAVAVVTLGLVLLAGIVGARLLHIGNMFWLLYHFSKQSWGMICLSASATSSARPPSWIKYVYVAASVGATAVCLIPVQSADPLLSTLRLEAVVVTWTCVALGLVHSVASSQASTHGLHRTLLATGALFFAPVLLIGPLDGLAVVGTVHGLQYTALMCGIGADRKQGVPVRRLLILAAFAAGLFAMYWVCMRATWWGGAAPLMGAIYLSVQMWHFVVDADLWRLSNPTQRQAIKESFPYLFPRARSA